MLKVSVVRGNSPQMINGKTSPEVKINFASTKMKSEISKMLIPLIDFMKKHNIVLDVISISDTITTNMKLETFVDTVNANSVDVLNEMLKNEFERICVYLNTKYDVETNNFIGTITLQMRDLCSNIVSILSK